MDTPVVRIRKIAIRNFKNIKYASLSLENTRKDYKASVLGLYGQNGSGKTALIDSLSVLQIVLQGQSLSEKYADLINVDSDFANLCFDFSIKSENKIIPVQYQFDIRIVTESYENGSNLNVNVHRKVCIENEILKCPILSDKKTKTGKLVDTDSDDIISPKSKKDLLIGKDKVLITDLIVSKRLSYRESRSFVFSREFLSAINSNKERKKGQDSAELDFYSNIIDSLVSFGHRCLFVINTSNTGLISLNAQPFVFRINEESNGALGTIALPINEPVVIPIREKDVVTKVIQNMNTVLQKIIPGLTICVRELGTQALPNGETGSRIQFMSTKNNKEIPFEYESEGIKKIVSILQLLIVVYNQSSITVAIDELDSGIFEYLLGELIRLISEKGKGQLIFTSHNLRPLETLDRGFVAFTTTNPSNRYVRLTNVKETNNLRDFYYRDIMLKEQDKELYEPTNNSEISMAFRAAGEDCGA